MLWQGSPCFNSSRSDFELVLMSPTLCISIAYSSISDLSAIEDVGVVRTVSTTLAAIITQTLSNRQATFVARFSAGFNGPEQNRL